LGDNVDKVMEVEVGVVREIYIAYAYLDLKFYCYCYGFEMCLEIDLAVFNVIYFNKYGNAATRSDRVYAVPAIAGIFFYVCSFSHFEISLLET